jgi:hypothetical protein
LEKETVIDNQAGLMRGGIHRFFDANVVECVPDFLAAVRECDYQEHWQPNQVLSRVACHWLQYSIGIT